MVSETEVLEKLRNAVVEGDDELARKTAGTSLTLKMDPMVSIKKGLMKGMGVIGERFAKSEVFVTQVMLAAEAMKAAMEVLKPKITEKKLSEVMLGKVVIGTVKGDIHDIGKNIVATSLEASGFEVYDIGTDVPTMKFIEKAKEVNADIIAASALLSTTMPFQGEITKVLNEIGLRDKYKVLVGGAPTSQEWAKEVGADGYGVDVFEAVKEARRLMEAKK